ncbi:MAG: tRNA 2-selenouridine(34) synthase MnmH [Betaproteobacteria bacterium]
MNFPAPRHGPGTKIGLESLPAYIDRIDVRSPAEYAIDHIPGAVNLPVLGDHERKVVGTMNAQDSAFAARRQGAALVSRNIAGILETQCRSKPREWAPVVYCWRGGKRSASLAHVLNEIGWRAVQLDGGYRTWRRHVVSMLTSFPARFRYIVVCGLTGSGKSRLLSALHSEGAQVLDLELLARHRGSLLGGLPGDPQPSQKAFDTDLLTALEQLDPARPVYVESESRRIGTLQVPDVLLDAMRAAECVCVDTPQTLRVALLKEEYTHYIAEPESLADNLSPLVPVHGRKTIERWVAAAAAKDFDTLIDELLALHYDPTYGRSMLRNFPRHAQALHVTPHAIDLPAFRALARDLDAQVNARFHATIPVPASA